MLDLLQNDAEERARQAFSSSPIYALRCLRIDTVGESLQISGRVATFYIKQLAQELLRSVADGKQVVNRVDVDLDHHIN